MESKQEHEHALLSGLNGQDLDSERKGVVLLRDFIQHLAPLCSTTVTTLQEIAETAELERARSLATAPLEVIKSSVSTMVIGQRPSTGERGSVFAGGAMGMSPVR